MAYEKLVLAAALEPCELGQEFTNLPAHLTIVPPFSLLKDNLGLLHSDLQERLEENPRLRIVGGQQAQYGSAGEVTVREVNGIMFGLHAACAAVVRRLGGHFDQTYTGPGWSPHVSDVSALCEGQDICLDEVQLFKYLRPDLKVVEAIYTSQEVRING